MYIGKSVIERVCYWGVSYLCCWFVWLVCLRRVYPLSPALGLFSGILPHMRRDGRAVMGMLIWRYFRGFPYTCVGSGARLSSPSAPLGDQGATIRAESPHQQVFMLDGRPAAAEAGGPCRNDRRADR